MLTSSDGTTVFVVATSQEPADPYDLDLHTIAYDADSGKRRWAAGYEGTEEQPFVLAQSIALSPSGDTVYALANQTEWGWATCAAIVVAYDTATGLERWHSAYSGPPDQPCANAWGIGAGVVHGPSGAMQDRVFVLSGTIADVDGTRRPVGAVLALEGRTGAVAWERLHTGTSASGTVLLALAVSPDGATLYAAGGENRSDGLRKDFTTVAFDAATGNLRWEAHDPVTEPEGFFGNNGAVDVVVSPDGSRVFLTGIDPVLGSDLLSAAESALLTYAHDATSGEGLWRGRYTGAGDGKEFHFALFEGTLGMSPDGSRLFVAGSQTTDVTGGWMHGISIVAYDTGSGARLWWFRSRDPYKFSSFLGFEPALAVAGDRVVVTGPRGNHNVANAVTVAVDASSGQQQWIARYGQTSSYPGAIAASPGGKSVFVATLTKLVNASGIFVDPDVPGNSWDLVTVSYQTKTPP